MNSEAPEPDWVAARRARLLQGLDVRHSSGIEIGALAMPMVRKGEGDIRYVDWADRATLAAKYADDPNVPIANLVEIDGVWGERSLAECFPGEAFDYVVASHVIEHVPDMIGWLQEISQVLRLGGLLYLAVPDRRYTFDHYRRTSSLAEFIGAWLTRSRQPDPRQIFDQGAYHSQLDPGTTWDKRPNPADHLNVARLRESLAIATVVATQPHYLDIHCWVFTPRSMLDTLLALAELGLLPFRCARFEPTLPMENEMLVVLEKATESDPAIRQSLLDALTRLRAEDPATDSATDEPWLGHALRVARPPAPPKTRTPYWPAIGRRLAALAWYLPRRRAVPDVPLAAEPFPALSSLGVTFPPYRPDWPLFGPAHRDLAAGAQPAGLLRSPIPGFLRVADAQALYGFAAGSKGDILELGSSGPLSTVLLCRAVRDRRSAARVLSIDGDGARQADTRRLLSEQVLDRCYEGRAGEAAGLLPELARQGRRFGFVFIDFAQDFESVRPVCDLLAGLLLPGAVLLFHDFNDERNRTEPGSCGIYGALQAWLAGTAEIEFVGLVGCCAILRNCNKARQ